MDVDVSWSKITVCSTQHTIDKGKGIWAHESNPKLALTSELCVVYHEFFVENNSQREFYFVYWVGKSIFYKLLPEAIELTESLTVHPWKNIYGLRCVVF